MPRYVCTDEDVRIGARVIAARKAAGLPMHAVAAVLGISYQQLQRYEQGRSRLSGVALHRLARLFRCTAGDFLDPVDWEPRAIRSIAARNAVRPTTAIEGAP